MTAAKHAPAHAKEPPPRGKVRRAAYLLGPPLLLFAAWWGVGVAWDFATARECLLAAALFLTIVGPTVILGPAVVGIHGFDNVSTWGLVAVAAFMTVVTTFFWVYNLDLLERVPKVGPALKRARSRMSEFLKGRRWLRRAAVFGTGLFVLLPLPGSGTLGGSLLARLLGLTRLAAFLSVALGGLAVTAAYGWFGDGIHALSERYQLSVPAKLGMVAGLLLVLWLIGRAVSRATPRK